MIARSPGIDVLMLCSNATHVTMFAPVLAALESRGLTAELLSLDAYYGQGAVERALELGLPVRTLRRRGGSLTGGFYDRKTIYVWRDVIAARRPVIEALADPPTTVVAGNDFGLVEKLVLAQARSQSVGTVLVQDGRLSPAREGPASAGSWARWTVKRGISAALEQIGLGGLASSRYGEWGADVVCAAGHAGASLLRSRARSRTSRVVVTGQPRYDALLPLMPQRHAWDAAKRSIVSMFTTPFAADRLGTTEQENQEALAAELATAVRAAGHRFVVKPHPRESRARYAQLLGPGDVSGASANELLALSTVAIVGISSVVEEAGLLGVPVVVPGVVVHGQRFDRRLPDPRTYPRFESAEEVARLLEPSARSELRRLTETQSRQVGLEIAFDPISPAAEAVANAILGVVTERRSRTAPAGPA
ncbi:MAG TPA: hypothetical protein VGK63_06060 [Candidatus Limnocylindrales bacterium]